MASDIYGSVELSAILAEPRTGTGHSSILFTPSPDRVPVPALFATGFPGPKQQLTRVQRRNEVVCRTDAIAQATHAADHSRAS